MSGGSHIRAVGAEGDATQGAAAAQDGDAPLTLEAEWAEDWDETPARRTWGWLVPVAAALAVAGWTAFFVWAWRGEMLARGTPRQWIGWVVEWTGPTLLVIALWLLAMRNSRREAVRFADTAAMLARESRELESRLVVVNRELSLAREFLAAQSRELESLGRVAASRISEHAAALQGLIVDNGAQVEAIAGVSAAALENMDRLRGDLPVIANSARDVSNQIGGAGRTAHEQIGELVAGFQRLNEFGQASERQVASLRARVGEALAAFEAQAAQLDEIAEQRFAALRDKSEDFRVALDGREVEALAAMRLRADRLREEIAAAREELDGHEAESLNSLQARIRAVREGAATVGRSLSDAEKEAVENWRRQVSTLKLDLHTVIQEVERVDAAALESANRRLADLRAESERGDAQIAALHREFDEAMARRRAEAEARAGEDSAALARRFGEIDAEIAARREAFEADLANRLETLRALQAEAAEALGARLAELDSALADRRSAHLEDSRKLAAEGDEILARTDALAAAFAEARQQGVRAVESIAAAVERLVGLLESSHTQLDGTDKVVSDLTDASVRLLELIQAAVQHSGGDLTNAIATAEGRLAEAGGKGHELRLMLEGASAKGAELSDYLIAAKAESASSIEDIEAFQTRFAEANRGHADQLAALRGQVARLDEDSAAAAGRAQTALREAIAQLESAAMAALSQIEEGSAERIASLADSIGSRTAEALDRSVRDKTLAAIAEIDQAAAGATGAGREAVVQLRDQLARVNELAGNLETRVARARERAEEQVDNDFSRRMALITEALNSNAIDIAKALSSEVTDTAWTSYLRGDRGIFTRRAVRLLDNTEARDIAEIYDSDTDFREHVSRYIHDFEAMLRSMLSTRDGHALGVTLLSSDMGKLYVALAQAIERLRE
jgi:hypothetical protein